MNNLKVTLGIPTFQRFNYLKEAVTSARLQTYSNIEILISDDGNNIDIQDWCLRLEKEDQRVRYLKNSQRRGLSGNWNSILENATGDYINIIGDDDRYLPDFIEKMLYGMSMGADVVFSSHYLINEFGKRLSSETLESEIKFYRNSLEGGFLKNPDQSIWRNSIPMSASLFKNFKRKIFFDEKLNTPEIIYYLELSQLGKSFFYVPEFLLEFRVHKYSSTFSGLWTERLVSRLIEFTTRPDEVPLKNALISSMIINAVSRAISKGDRVLAKKLIASAYYSSANASDLVKKTQQICIVFPNCISSRLYDALRKYKQIFKRSE